MPFESLSQTDIPRSTHDGRKPHPSRSFLEGAKSRAQEAPEPFPAPSRAPRSLPSSFQPCRGPFDEGPFQGDRVRLQDEPSAVWPRFFLKPFGNQKLGYMNVWCC